MSSVLRDARFRLTEIVSSGSRDTLRLIVAVPEPSTALLLGSGLSICGAPALAGSAELAR